MNTFALTNENIDRISSAVTDFLTRNKIESRTVNSIRLAAEEILLTYQEKLGCDAQVQVSCEKRLGRPRVTLHIPGESTDPFADLSDDHHFLHKMMERMSIAPAWYYRRNRNVITFTPPVQRQLSSFALILGAIILGVLLGVAARFTPGDVGSVLIDSYLSPVSSAIMGLLSTVSVFIFFFSVINGICGMGDISTFNKIGKRFIGRILIIIGLSALVCVAVSIPFYKISLSGETAFNAAALWQMILDIVPTNIVDSFLTGNTLQIIFLAIFIGITLLMISSKTPTLLDGIFQTDLLFQTLIQNIVRLMPVILCISCSKLVLTCKAADILCVLKFHLLNLGCTILIMLFMLIKTTISHRVSPSLLLKKLLPTMIIALSTSSSAAAFSTNMDTCKNKLGVDKQLVNVGLPLGQILLKPTVSLLLITSAMCFAEMYGLTLAVPQLITLSLSAFILAIAAPPVPGASAAICTLLFSQMGIPVDAVSFIIATDALTDRLGTTMDLFVLQLELVNISASLGNLDEKTLRAE